MCLYVPENIMGGVLYVPVLIKWEGVLYVPVLIEWEGVLYVPV